MGRHCEVQQGSRDIRSVCHNVASRYFEQFLQTEILKEKTTILCQIRLKYSSRVEYLPSMCVILKSIPRRAKKMNKQTQFKHKGSISYKSSKYRWL